MKKNFIILSFFIFKSVQGEANQTIKYLQSKDVNPEFRIEDKQTGFAKLAINIGKENLKFLYGNEAKKIAGYEEAKNTVDYLKSIVNICWTLYDMAVEKGQGFTGGTIVFIDPGYKLYNYLLEYSKRVNPDILKDSLNPGYTSSNCLAYSRKSTHFDETKDQEDFEGQFGIDVRYSQKDKLQPILPANKQHILFGKLPNNLTFLKFEIYGTCRWDGSAVYHAAELIKTKALRIKNISRKEHVPEEIKKSYKAVVAKLNKENQTEAKKKTTINEMYKYLKGLKDLPTPAKTFINKLETDKNYDHPGIRRGFEVILDNPYAK